MITKFLFDNYNGKKIHAYTLKDKISVTVLTLGATIIKLEVPDKNGNMVDVALGMKNADDVITKGDYMGAVVGRCGNRIANGKFTLDGKEYVLDLNDGGKAHLHGGFDGFNKKVYDATVEGNSLLLTMTSPDGDQGYGGEVTLTVKYTVEGATLNIEYFATTDSATVINPTNHVYFNLNGESDGSILDNVLQLNADCYLAVNSCLIPTHKVAVAGTPFDFTSPKAIGQDIAKEDEQLKTGGGYDHNFCLTDSHFATAYSPKTGIVMDCYTDLCGVQFYSGNFLVGNVGKSAYPYRSGFCLETQLWPDAINHPDYEQPVLRKGEQLYTKTQYVFSVKK